MVSADPLTARKGVPGGERSSSSLCLLGQLWTFTERTVEEKQAGSTQRLRLGPAEFVLPTVAWPGLQNHVGVHSTSPSSSSCPRLTSHHVLAAFKSLLNSKAALPSCQLEAWSSTAWSMSQFPGLQLGVSVPKATPFADLPTD